VLYSEKRAFLQGLRALHYSFGKESVSSVQEKGEAFSSSWCQNEYRLGMGFHNFSREEKKQF